MPFEHPAECKTEGQRLSRSFRAEELLRLEHDKFAGDTSPDAMAHRAVVMGKLRTVQAAREAALADARTANYPNGAPPWVADASDWNGSSVDFPPGLNQSNEGSKMSYLARLKSLADTGPDPQVGLDQEYRAAKQACKEGTYWDSTIDIEVI
jgi:hypothetical protein